MIADSLLFIEAARNQGYSAAAAEAALDAVHALATGGRPMERRYFCFRSGGGSLGAGAGSDPQARPRVLLLFPSADEALSFAQRSGLGAAPRLMALSLGQALTVLLQRPAIGALLITAEGAAAIGPGRQGLPAGVRVERTDLLALLAGEAA